MSYTNAVADSSLSTSWRTIDLYLQTATKIVGTYSIQVPSDAKDCEQIYGVSVPKGYIKISIERIHSTLYPEGFKDRYSFTLLKPDAAMASFKAANQLVSRVPQMPAEFSTEDGVLIISSSNIEVDLYAEGDICKTIQFCTKNAFVTIPWNDRLQY